MLENSAGESMGYFPLGVRACARSRCLSHDKISAISHAVTAAFLAAYHIPATAPILHGSPSSTRTDTPRSRPRSPAEAAAWPAVAAELVPPGPPHCSANCHAGQLRPANLHQTVAKRRWVWLEGKAPLGGLLCVLWGENEGRSIRVRYGGCW